MNTLFNSIYSNKKVLITGNTGFKGSWLSLWLHKMGANVLGVSLPPSTTPNHFSLINLPVKTDFIDITHFDKLKKTITKFSPDIIFHLAAQPLVRYSYKNTLETFNTNIIGTANLFESIKELDSIQAIVNVTTDKCYENLELSTGYKETDRLGGHDPYSASKACSEIVTNSYKQSFFYSKNSPLIATARAGNVIGGGDWSEDRLVPDLIKAAINNTITSIRSPYAIRPWQHVLESLTGYLMLGQKLLEGNKDYAGPWNFGPNESEFCDVKSFLSLAKSHWKKITFNLQEDNNLHETNTLMLNSSKANSKLGWKSVWTIEESIEKTITWYKQYYNNQVLSTEEQLIEYINLAKQNKSSWT